MTLPLDTFLDEARKLLAPGDCDTRVESLERAAIATFPTSTRVWAVLTVRDVAKVAPLVRLCAAHGVAYHVFSAGTNWGLGSRSPPCDGVLFDLSQLKAIRHFDPVHGSLTLEPGVTFRQAHDFLVSRAAQFWLAPVGGTDRASVLANALQRGDGFGPLADRAAHCAALEVVLPNGEQVRTGFAGCGTSAVARVAKDGTGASLDGLFFQSSLGIVTAMTVWLSPVPRAWQKATLAVGGTGPLAALVDRLGMAMRAGLCSPGSWTIWNVYKLLALNGRYPWKRTRGEHPLDHRFIGQAGQPQHAPWYLTLTLCAADEALLGCLRDRTHALFEGAMHWLQPMASSSVADFEPANPNPENLRTVYWRKRFAVPADIDPQRDRCGLIWICVKAPADGTVAPALVQAQALALAHGFELHTAFSPVSVRALNVYGALVYDREEPGEDERAARCHDELVRQLHGQGYPLYRSSRMSQQSAACEATREQLAIDAIANAWRLPFTAA